MPLKDLEARKEYQRKWYQRYKKKHPDAEKKKWQRLRANPEEHKKQIEKRRERYHNPDCDRKQKTKNDFLKTTYGITLDDYNRMFEEQRGCCAICGRHQSDFVYALGVDHNHNKKGKDAVRGLLCSVCNRDLSVVENEEYLFTLMEYLYKYE